MRVHTSPFPDIEIPEGTITDYVLRRVDDLPEQPAIIDGPSGRTVTYRGLANLIGRLAAGLAARGFGNGDVFGVLLPNLPEYAVVFHGVATVGGTSTTINPTYTAEEINYQLVDSGARFLVTIPLFLDTALEAVEGTAVEEVFVLGEDERATPFAALLADASFSGEADIDPDEDIAVMPYSSGTTGMPKGVMLSHRNLAANLAQVEHLIGHDDGDAAIAVLPFFHIYGMQVLMNLVVGDGGTVITMPRFDLEEFLRLIQDHRVTHAYAVPPIVLALAKHPIVEQYDLSSLKRVFSGAAPLGAKVAAEASRRIGCEVVQGYGMTELSPVTHATPLGGFKPGSIGVAISNTEARIVDPDTGEDLGLGEDGEMWIRGPQVMKGYLNNPEATAATIDADGWLHTGDIGHVDADGHFFIVDRLKELIKYKGFQVAPAELEALLLTHPEVADAAVVPIPDEEAGELPKAFVVAKPGQDLTAEDVQGFVAGHVAHYKEIRAVEFVDEIPKSASGKILRRLLRDRA